MNPEARTSFTVYVLFSPTYRKTYTGFTSNLNERILAHNFLAKKGYTVKFRPWVVVHVEEFPTKAEALKREQHLKTGKGREFVQTIIKSKYG